MDTLLLALGIVVALLTFNVYRPRRGVWTSAVSFFAGWLMAELAFFGLLVGAAIIAWGALAVPLGTAGQVGLGLLVASWIALLVYAVKAMRMAGLFERAVTDAFGERFDQHMATRRQAGLVEGPSWKRMLRPFSPHRRSVEAIRGVKFKEVDGIELELDIYKPRGDVRDCPVLLNIHGGGWTQNWGDRTQQALPLMNHLAENGWVCVTISYRLSPRFTFPDHLHDCKSALVWVREHIAEYGGDPNFIVVSGGSAGGHLALLVALTQNDPEYQQAHPGADTSVQGCVPVYACYDFLDREGHHPHAGMERHLRTVMKLARREDEEAYRLASPVHRVHAGAPPMLVVQGASDTLIPVTAARHFVSELRGVSQQPVAYAELPLTQHAFELFASPHTEHHVHGVEYFLNFLHASRRQSDGNKAAGD